MDNGLVRRELEDFKRFCTGFNVRDVIAAADLQGHADGYEKEVYALAILRAVRNGDFGDDRRDTHEAISALWQKGCRNGFTVESFNEVFEKFFIRW